MNLLFIKRLEAYDPEPLTFERMNCYEFEDISIAQEIISQGYAVELSIWRKI